MQMTTPSSRPRPSTGHASSHPRRVAALRAGCIACFTAAVILYGIGPLATLWQAANGIRHNDVAALRAALDWRSVREGLKQDMGASPTLSASLASAQAPVDDLPGFGESFATTVVSHAIDDHVTPEMLVSMLSGSKTPAPAGVWQFLGRIQRLDFTSPTHFEAAIRSSDDPSAEPVRISLQLSKWHWRITRIKFPAEAAPLPRIDRT